MTIVDSNQHPFALYNPALLPADVLLAEFTARRPMLENLLAIIKGNKAGQPPQHCLLIGARGAGKTTTLWAIAHSVARHADLRRQWQPVVFDEESRRVGDLADFWLEAIRQWEHATQDNGDRAKRLLEEAPANIEERARTTFADLVDRSGKRALLLIDNLNELFASIHDPEPLHRLRAYLMRESRLMLVGTATRQFEQVTSLDQPFNDFFRCFELRPLSLEEMKTSLVTLAEIRGDESVKRTLEERGGTVRTLHLLTGGNPRLIKTFYRLIKEGLHGDIRADLERLLDEFTPYFKAIVDALPGQQQRIFDAVALAWDPVEVSTIATTTRLPSNQVSAQLRALIKAGLISEAAGHPKRKTYLLTDRFSNIHYLMRHGRAARNRFDWFVALVRLVFPDGESGDILARVARAAAECGPEGQRDARAVLYSALERAESAEARRALLHATLRESWNRSALESLDQWFDTTKRAQVDLPEVEILAFCQQMPAALRKELGYKPAEARWWFRLTSFLEERGALNLAESAYCKAIELNPDWAKPWTFYGDLLRRVGRMDEAESKYRRAIQIEPAYAFAWTALGNHLRRTPKRSREAEAAFRKAIELDPAEVLPWALLGALLGSTARLQESEAAFRKAVETAPENAIVRVSLAVVLETDAGTVEEARSHVRRAILSEPENEIAQAAFVRLCQDHEEDLHAVLPALAEWSVVHPQAAPVFDFTAGGLVQLARLTSPAEALALLDALPDATPFETLRDAFRAHGDRDYLNRLAPERRSVAIELLGQFGQPATTSPARPARSPKTRPARSSSR